MQPSAQSSVLRSIVIAIALAGFAGLLWLNRSVLILAFGSIVLATVLRSGAAPIARLTRLPARWAVLVAIVLLVVLGVGTFWLFGLRISEQFSQLQQQLPDAMQRVREWLGQSAAGDWINQALDQAGSSAAWSRFGLAAKATAGAITDMLLMAFAAIYLAMDPGVYLRGMVRLLPCGQRDRVSAALDKAGTALTKWVRAQLVLMLSVGVLTGIGLALVGVPLAFSLAVIGGLLEFIPLLGPILGAVPGILVGFSEGPRTALYALLVYIAVQQIEGNLLTPIVQRWAVQLPPVLALFAVLLCGLTFGLTGIVFATPLAVVAMILTRELYVKDTLESPSPPASRPASTSPSSRPDRPPPIAAADPTAARDSI